MGIYEEYMKSLNAIGLGPKRELEPQVARPHAFGNPFKLDKKNMSIVDEVFLNFIGLLKNILVFTLKSFEYFACRFDNRFKLIV